MQLMTIDPYLDLIWGQPTGMFVDVDNPSCILFHKSAH